MLRKLAFVALLAIVMAAAYGSASGLLVSGGAIQVGADVTYCDTTGVDVLGWGLETDLDPDTVSSVRIGNIDAACAGNSMFVQLYDGTQTKIFAETIEVPVVSPQTTVNFPGGIDPERIDQLRIWIEGPNN